MTGGSQKGQVLLCETLRLLTASFHELYQFATVGQAGIEGTARGGRCLVSKLGWLTSLASDQYRESHRNQQVPPSAPALPLTP